MHRCGGPADRHWRRMSTAASAQLPLSTLDDDAWDDLLSFIEERRVIPIVGPELLQVDDRHAGRGCCTTGSPRSSPRGSTSTSPQLPQPYTLNDVVCWFLAVARPARGGLRAPARHPQGRELRAAAGAAPAGAITDFDLFVTTTFDPLLEQAINLERFGGAPSTEVLAYAPNRVADLPVRARPAAAPGRLPPVRPALGLADLRDLRRGPAGVHLRAAERAPGAGEAVPRARAQPPAVHRQQLHQLAGAAVPAHGQAPAPVRPARRRRGPGRRPHQPGRAAGGVPAAGQRAHAHLQRRRALRRRAAPTRWHARRKPRGERPRSARRRSASCRRRARCRTTPCSSATRARTCAAVQQIKAGLEAAGITTWFDMDRLEGGDDYDRKIQRNIARCSYFIPVVSATTQRRLEGYFRREWSYAIDRARNMADGAVFILPVTHRRHRRRRGAGARQVQGAALHAAARRRGAAPSSRSA